MSIKKIFFNKYEQAIFNKIYSKDTSINFGKKYKKVIRQTIKPKRINFAYLKSINPAASGFVFFFQGVAYLH